MTDSMLYNRLQGLTAADFLHPYGIKQPEVEREHDSAVSEKT